MANYNLNDARKIVYLDKDGEQQAVKEVWYIGSAGKYKVWPGDIYLTDIKIEDQYGNEYDLEYVNGEPTYKRNNITYTGLSPNTKYYIKGTLKVMRYQNDVNTVIDTIENCYPMHYTTDKSSGDGIWSGSNEGVKYNPMVDMDVQYNVYSCTSDKSSKDDSNVYLIPTMGYWTPWIKEGQVMLGLQGEEKDFGIELKRAQRTSYFTHDSIPSSVSLKWNEEVEFATGLSYYGSWDGPTNTRTSIDEYEITYTNNNNDPNITSEVISVSIVNNTVKVRCLKDIYSNNAYIFNVTPKQVDPWPQPTGITGYVTIRPPYWYRVTVNNQSVISGHEMSPIKIDGDYTVVLERSDNLDTSSPTYETVSSYTLTSSNDQIVNISEHKLKAVKTGTANITVYSSSGDEIMKFPVEVSVAQKYYIEMTGFTSSGSSEQLLSRTILASGNTRTATIRSNMNAAGINFYSASDGNINQTVYWTTDGTLTNWMGFSSGSGSSISLALQTTPRGTGKVTFTFGSTYGGTDLGKLEVTVQ